QIEGDGLDVFDGCIHNLISCRVERVYFNIVCTGLLMYRLLTIATGFAGGVFGFRGGIGQGFEIPAMFQLNF
ncbi:hypothetical protein MM716_32415, partial [Klebsiella pneumoniae]|nr:hypothetical protein [Klebsiella pneumoniae]